MTYTFGKMVRDTRQGWAIFAAMSVLFLVGVFVALLGRTERESDPWRSSASSSGYTGTQSGGNMEGKEVRFGIPMTALFATVTTDASCGAVIGMHDSFTPLGGLVPLFNMQTDEVIFGGVGAGLYGMLLYAILAVFIAGLMVGRTPEYVGKKIEQKEVKMAMHRHIATAFEHPCVHGRQLGHSFRQGLAIGTARTVPATGNLNNGGPSRLLRNSLRVHQRQPATTAAPLRESVRIRPGTT